MLIRDGFSKHSFFGDIYSVPIILTWSMLPMKFSLYILISSIHTFHVPVIRSGEKSFNKYYLPGLNIVAAQEYFLVTAYVSSDDIYAYIFVYYKDYRKIEVDLSIEIQS